MKTILNQKQKNYLLDTFFEDGREIRKVFDTADRAWIASKKMAISDVAFFIPGWPTILWDGEPVTAINAERMPEEWAKLLSLGAR